MDDNSLMPFGEHKGLKMIYVPAPYLLWLLGQGKCYGELKDYLEENKKALELEVSRNKNKKYGR